MAKYLTAYWMCPPAGGGSIWKITVLCGLFLWCASGRPASRPDEISFEKLTIDLGASETAAFADINRDGKLDLVSGEYWYEAPGWTKHRFRQIEYTENYVDDLSTLPLDVDGDGYVDLITSGWFSKKLAWWRNPGRTGEMWQQNTIASGSPIEFSFLVDLDNDGKAEEILPQFGDDRPLAWYERDKRGGMVEHIVSDHSYGHGIGAGDVNGDGRNDILTPKGWLEANPRRMLKTLKLLISRKARRARKTRKANRLYKRCTKCLSATAQPHT